MLGALTQVVLRTTLAPAPDIVCLTKSMDKHGDLTYAFCLILLLFYGFKLYCGLFLPYLFLFSPSTYAFYTIFLFFYLFLLLFCPFTLQIICFVLPSLYLARLFILAYFFKRTPFLCDILSYFCCFRKAFEPFFRSLK